MTGLCRVARPQPPPGLPRKRGRRSRRAARPAISRGGSVKTPPAQPSSPPACGRGWGRVPRRDGLLPGRTAANPHPASPASGGGGFGAPPAPASGGGEIEAPSASSSPGMEESRRHPPHPSPLPLAGGVGGGSRGATGLCRAARPPAPTRPPPQAGEEKSRRRLPRHLPGWRSRGATRPILLPSRLREGLGEGPAARRAFAGPHGRRPPPGLPRKRGRRNRGAGCPAIFREGGVEAEDQPHHCHRRLVAAYLDRCWGGIEVEHLGMAAPGSDSGPDRRRARAVEIDPGA